MNEPISRDAPPSPPSEGEDDARSGRFSVARLSSAFARLMSATSVEPTSETDQRSIAPSGHGADDSLKREIHVTPERIVEAAIFVGRHDGSPIRASEIAAHIRDVEAAEVEAIVAQLNRQYAAESAAYLIERDGPGFRMRVRPELDQVRQRFRGRIRTAKLSPLALEVLSLVAYRQPISGAGVDELRGTRSHAILSQLVRRRLLTAEKDAGAAATIHFRTTERFNQLFDIRCPADLPRSEDLDDS